MTDKLKPCPFCGFENIELWPMGAFDSPFCESCGATIAESVTGEDTSEQIAAWNRRADKANGGGV